MICTITLTFPTEGELRHTETDNPFEFVVKEGNKRYNQRHYEAVGEVSWLGNS